jgi:hypothetical protein
MKEAIKQHDKRCPVCKKRYPAVDNYCGDDGAVLELIRATSAKHMSRSPEVLQSADELPAERK